MDVLAFYYSSVSIGQQSRVPNLNVFWSRVLSQALPRVIEEQRHSGLAREQFSPIEHVH